MKLDIYGPVTQLNGVGDKLQQLLSKLHITRVMDVLLHLPMRYQDKSSVAEIAHLQINKEALVEGIIRHAHISQGRQKVLTVTLDDTQHRLDLVFFHFSDKQAKAFTSGKKIRVFGQAKTAPYGWQMMHPEYQLNPPPLNPQNAIPVLQPVYATTAGISQRQWQDLQLQSLSLLQLSQHTQLLGNTDFDNLQQLLSFIHQPPVNTDIVALQHKTHPALIALAFEELLAHQLSLLHLRHNTQNHQAVTLPVDKHQQQHLLEQMGFNLTTAQQRVLDDIHQDLIKSTPMMRLVQGDVGSGKTAVAAMAALTAVSNGYQVALLAPTEILAEQHYHCFKQWFQALDISVEWLVSRHSSKHKNRVLAALKSHHISIFIGTHAIFQQDVIFDKLALVIIDEQHRFGVHQRLALRDKGRHIVEDTGDDVNICYNAPHQLVMTATPIPRTLAMCAYADLDSSIIDTLPAGRQPIETRVMEQHKRQALAQRIQSLCQKGQQVYWVCTLVQASESLDCQSAEQTAQLLQQQLPDLAIGLVHGQQDSDTKNQTMQAFTGGKLDVLVATTVIEVGVNVPNATLMVIENPERLGLAQLHQLRGRVGRGKQQSYCVLLYASPLSDTAKQRLQVMRDSNDGFIIAEKDLQLRGAGELLGTQQSGIHRFKVADLQLHAYLIDAVDQYAKNVIRHNSNAEIAMLSERWINAADDYVQA